MGMAAKTYRLRIGGDGKEFEAEGDKAFVRNRPPKAALTF
jgi:hypothetical protein